MPPPAKAEGYLLARPVTAVHSIGARSAARLAKLGIRTVRDLLWHLPSRYEDYSRVTDIADIVPGEKQSVTGEVIAVSSRFIWPRRLTVTTATGRDATGAVRAVWYNQPYLEDSLPVGTQVSLAGKAVLDKRGLYLANPSQEKTDPDGTTTLRHTGRLVPVYPETEGVTSKFLRFLLQPLLERIPADDPLPGSLRDELELIPLADAVRVAHFPADVADVAAAKSRMAFDDLLMLQLKALRHRRVMNLRRSPALPMDAAFVKKVLAGLPYALTHDQKVAIHEILKDMERPYPMNRLLQGDVGSGKTVVAAVVARHAARHGRTSVLLAPTEVLAVQHYRTLASLGMAGDAVLLTASSAMVSGKPATKVAAKRALATGKATLAVGTHALLQGDVTFKNLALVVVDEQHRFGIAQRAALLQRDSAPHLLSMTATPIPRTLALTVMGDLDISALKEKPAGRLPVATAVVPSTGRRAMEQAIREQIRQGRQVFVICPVIEKQENTDNGRKGQSKFQWAEAKAVTDEYERLKKSVFTDAKIAMLHGRMKAVEKERVMREFKEGWHDILVSTSVVEVGVDVPNATVMLIEGAERFGLAQLHQFRGRVGRGEHQSYCFLAASEDGAASHRLKVLEKNDDGFALAEADLKHRGPGEFFGLKQSGMSEIALTALADPDLVKKARLAARTLMKASPTLAKYPLLKEQLESLAAPVHAE